MGTPRLLDVLSRYGAVLALLPLISISPAGAATRQQFDIPAQSLRSALIALAGQADISIGLTDVNLTNRTSRALTELNSVEEALQRLLAGTELTFEMIDPTTWRIYPRPISPAGRPHDAVIPLTPPPIEEITVTAAKRPLALQATANSIAAVTGKVFSDYGAQSPKDMASFMAGLSVTNQGPGRNKYIVRGLSDGPFIGNTQSTVGVYIDETRAIYNAPDPNLQLFDIDRVEVLRGPQGTLYGAGSIGGLVRLITRQPALGKFEAHASIDGNLGATTDPSGTVEGMVNLPVIDDILAIRNVAYARHEGGYINNSLLGKKHVNDADINGIRSNARLRLSPNWGVGAGITLQTIRAWDTQYFNSSLAPFSRRNRLAEPNSNDFLDVNLTVNGDLGWADLVSTTAWISHHVSSVFDASLALPDLLQIPPAPTAFNQVARYHTINHETRLVSSSPHALQWMAGIFISHRADAINSTLRLLTLSPLIDVFYVKNRHDSGTELAAFGETKYNLTPRLSIGAGVRIYRGTVNVTANNSQLIDVGPADAIGQNSKIGFTPKAEVSFQIDPDHLIYAEAAQGFRLGGINIASPLLRISPGRRTLTVSNFDSDRLWNFEVGSKSAFFNQRLILNATAFYAIWNDVQADLVRLNGLSFTANLGDAHIKGFELESRFAPNEHLLLFANLGWNDTQPTSTVLLPTSITGRLPAEPKLSGAVAAQYRTSLSDDYTGFINLKYDFTGKAHLAVGSLPMSEVSAYHIIGLRLGVERQQWKVSAYVNNLTDNRTNTYAFGNPFSLGRFSQVTPLRPRTFGLNITWTN